MRAKGFAAVFFILAGICAAVMEAFFSSSTSLLYASNRAAIAGASNMFTMLAMLLMRVSCASMVFSAR
jgi:hypothetical protein